MHGYFICSSWYEWMSVFDFISLALNLIVGDSSITVIPKLILIHTVYIILKIFISYIYIVFFCWWVWFLILLDMKIFKIFLLCLFSVFLLIIYFIVNILTCDFDLREKTIIWMSYLLLYKLMPHVEEKK